MLSDFLPKAICDAIYLKNTEQDINEIRIRLNSPIVIVCNLKTFFLSENGLNCNPNMAFFADSDLLNSIIFKASEFSMYSVNEQLKQGFLTVDGGIRIGVCGEVVIENNNIKTIKNISSICIRVPHQIKGVSRPIFNHLVSNEKINNTLIISPPGAGKTTMLRDIIYQFSYHNYPYNIFVADERGEITGGQNSKYELGYFFDSISFVSKKESILLGLRSMSPDIIITDEIGDKSDIQALVHIMNCGVSVIASIHGNSIEELRKNNTLSELFEGRYFKRYIVLSKRDGVGTIEGVYREDFTKIYGGTI